jgi:hypothetical protein
MYENIAMLFLPYCCLLEELGNENHMCLLS